MQQNARSAVELHLYLKHIDNELKYKICLTQMEIFDTISI